MELKELYTEVITEYSQSRKHHHPIEDPDVSVRGVNPSCGDDIALELRMNNNIIQQVALSGSGCAISEASAEMMAELMEGRTTEEAMQLIATFLGMIKKTVTEEKELEVLEDAVAFQNISNMPARVKCAVLAWHTMEEAIHKL